MEDSQLVEIIGTVKTVEKRNRGEKGTTFSILTLKSNTIVRIHAPFFCPVAEHDKIAICTDYDNKSLLILKSNPLVYIGKDEKAVKASLEKALFLLKSKASLKANNIYEFVKKTVL